MNSPTIRVAAIGAGLRTASYFSNLPQELQNRVQLAAIADPNPKHSAAFAQKFASLNLDAAPHFYDFGAQLLERESQLDAIIIGSPNHAHVADACPAFERGVPVLLEKPVAIDVEGCRRLWQNWQAAKTPPVTVGFVLRATPFYRRIWEIAQKETLGQMLCLDADENVGEATTRQMRSGWRKKENQCGGFMIEKCAHDFDLLRWIAGSEATRVSSFARRTHFVENSPRAEARFQKKPSQNEMLDYGDAATRRLFTDDTSGSLYENECELPDHQSVLIEWENGVTTCFTATLAQLRATRRMRIAGTRGNLEGDAARSHLILATENAGELQSEEIAIAHDSSGHHGGDGNTAAHFWNSAAAHAAGREYSQSAPAGLREGIEAVLIAIAAQRAARENQVVDVSELRRQVFGYSNGKSGSD
jgi:predicted dehydrogenase